ncbi:MAG: TatD family hydrolase [Candidatus Saccharimonadales bacterium]
MADLHFTDTHCHIHEALNDFVLRTETRKKYEKAGSPQPDDILKAAVAADVDRMICVGTTAKDSIYAVSFVSQRDHVWASIGIHPHEAKEYAEGSEELQRFAALATDKKVVAIGECGLDYYYTHSSKEDQERILRFQLDLAQKHDLPVIFHVRDAFDDFWPIFDEYEGIRGVIHSFSAGTEELAQILKRGLYVGLNGIMTFTKDPRQLNAAKEVPLERMLLETDAPFLTPEPYRGSICEPKHVCVTAEFLAGLRGETIERIAAETTANAVRVFKLR